MNDVSVTDGRNRRAGKAVAVLLTSAMLFGCAQNGGIAGMGQKESVGTGVGAGIGGLAGALLCKGNARVLCGVGGAVIGGLIGNRIGAMLDDEDQKALAEQSKQALVSQPDNAQVSWSSERSGATATIVPENTRVEQRQVKVVRDAKVAPAQNLDLIGARYQTASATRVRLAPSTDAEVATTLPGGSTIWAVGKVHDQPWIMVAQHGRSIGYVTASNVSPAPKPTAVAAKKPDEGKAAQTQVAYKQPGPPQAAFDLDASAPVRTPTDLDSLEKTDSTAKVDTVVASVTCRDLRTTATAKGQTETSTATACKSPDGSWELN
jgi:surface antigen